jgi:hypothetical protein
MSKPGCYPANQRVNWVIRRSLFNGRFLGTGARGAGTTVGSPNELLSELRLPAVDEITVIPFIGSVAIELSLGNCAISSFSNSSRTSRETGCVPIYWFTLSPELYAVSAVSQGMPATYPQSCGSDSHRDASATSSSSTPARSRHQPGSRPTTVE